MNKRIIGTLSCVIAAICVFAMLTACTSNDKIDDGAKTAAPAIQTPTNEPVTTEPITEPITEEATTVQPTPMSTPAEFSFENTLFIGDSRTDGLHEYGNLDEATFFAATSMNVFKLFESEIDVDDIGKATLNDVLSAKSYGKIYIMLGLNEMGYKFDTLVGKYTEVLTKLHEAQPDAIIYIQSVLHVSAELNETNTEENNTNINNLNAALKSIANGTYMFYMDINTVFDDADGCLDEQYTRDGCHLSAKHYPKWVEWLRTSTPTP